MKIIRYSVHGFKPQYQSHHLEEINYHLNDFDISEYPEHLQWIIMERHVELVKFYKENYDDLKEGIWVFLDGHKNNLCLNHLKRKVPCFEAEIRDDIMVFDSNLEKIVPITDNSVEAFGCYIPKRLIGEIHNIKRRKSKSTV